MRRKQQRVAEHEGHQVTLKKEAGRSATTLCVVLLTKLSQGLLPVRFRSGRGGSGTRTYNCDSNVGQRKAVKLG